MTNKCFQVSLLGHVPNGPWSYLSVYGNEGKLDGPERPDNEFFSIEKMGCSRKIERAGVS
jgi:hypothetical protein